MRRLALLTVALAGCATTASGSFTLYRGPPDSDGTHHRYWDSCGNYGGWAPLEMYFGKRGTPDVAWLDKAPQTPYRVLFDNTRQGSDEQGLVSAAVQQGAQFGADAMLRGVETTEVEPAHFSLERIRENRWVHLTRVDYSPGGPTGYTLGTTAIHYAEPGSEPYTGIICSTYSPYSASEREHLGDPLRLAAVRGAVGPAAAAGLRTGDFALEWWVNGTAGGYGDCWNLHESIRKAPPGSTVKLSLWEPTAAIDHLSLDVRLVRRLGVEIEAAGGKLVMRSPRPGGPAAVAGFLPGDVLTAIEGNAVSDLRGALATIRAGRVVQRYTVNRGGAVVELKATTEGFVGDLGLRNVPGVGVLVTFVPDTQLTSGLAPGDLITNVADWRSIDGQGAEAWPGDTDATLQVTRQGVAHMATFKTVAMDPSWYH